MTNTGPSVVSGDLGVSPGTAVVGFPPGQVVNGTLHAADAVALQAKSDLVAAYDDAAGRGPAVDKTSQDLGGQTLLAGVYRAASSLALTGTLTLDAQGDPAAVFVLQAGSTLLTASNSRVSLTGGAQACNVFWQVGSSATIGTGTSFVGSVLALTSITLQTGATVEGRMLARNGQVSLDTNTITRPVCAAPPPPTPTPTGSPTASPTGSPTSSPTAAPTSTSPSPSSAPSPGPGPGTGLPSASPSPNNPGPGEPSLGGPGSAGGAGGPGSPDAAGGPDDDVPGQPVVPSGHPETGRLELRGSGTWTTLGMLCLLGGAAAALWGSRTVPQRHRQT